MCTLIAYLGFKSLTLRHRGGNPISCCICPVCNTHWALFLSSGSFSVVFLPPYAVFRHDIAVIITSLRYILRNTISQRLAHILATRHPFQIGDSVHQMHKGRALSVADRVQRLILRHSIPPFVSSTLWSSVIHTITNCQALKPPLPCFTSFLSASLPRKAAPAGAASLSLLSDSTSIRYGALLLRRRPHPPPVASGAPAAPPPPRHPPHSQASPLRAPPGRAICGAASGRAPSNAGGGGGRSWGLPMLPAFEKAGPPPTPARGRGGEERRNDGDPLRWRVLRPLPRSRSGRRQPHPRGHCLRAEGASSGGGCRLALLPLVRASRPLSSAQCAPNICTPLEVSAPLTAPDGRCGPVAGHTGRRRSDTPPMP